MAKSHAELRNRIRGTEVVTPLDDSPPETRARRTGFLSTLYRAFRLITPVLIVVWLVVRIVQDREQLAGLNLQITPSTLALAIATGIAGYQCLFLGWLVLLKRTGLLRLRLLPKYARTWWISYLYRYVPGKVMVVVERARMGSELGIPPSVGATLAVIETALAVVSALLVTLVGWGGTSTATRFLWSGPLVFVAFVLLLPALLRGAAEWKPLARRAPSLSRLRLGSLDLLVAFPAFIGHYLFMGWSFAIAVRWVDADIPTPLPALVATYAFSHVIGLLTLLAPGGLGVREGAIGVQLSRWMGMGAAAAVAIGARVWFTAIELLCLAAVFALRRKA